jgi:hypothetical protein
MARDHKKQVKKVVKKAFVKATPSDMNDLKKKPIIEGEEEEAVIGKDRPINIGDDFEVPIEGGDDFGGALEEDDEEDDAVYGSSDDEDHHYE